MDAGNDFSHAVIGGFANAFHQLGSAGKIVLGIILAYLLLPVLLRVLSFFRRGGERV